MAKGKLDLVLHRQAFHIIVWIHHVGLSSCYRSNEVAALRKVYRTECIDERLDSSDEMQFGLGRDRVVLTVCDSWREDGGAL